MIRILLALLVLMFPGRAPAQEINGFLDSRIGTRLQKDPLQKDSSLGEIRLQIGVEKEFDSLSFNFVSDFIYDPVGNDHSINLETGRGFVDIREANLVFSPLDFVDVKMGRQILTWGTGDLIFINDLFPKDWNSFFIGRTDNYLKAPSDALKAAFFFDNINLDLVYTPRFDADRFIDGSRISFFDRATGSLRGRSDPMGTRRRDGDELAARVYRSFGAYEAAFYYYNGFWKSPAGFDEVTGLATFPGLRVYGASIRGPVARGIASVEIGYYQSEQGAGTNPLVRNGEFRLLIGYEQELAPELTGAIQYYLERRLGYDQYVASLPANAVRDTQNRHLLTVRLTKFLRNQDLKLSLFNFYSPSDKDGHLRLNLVYKITDNLKMEAGGNVFYGQNVHSFFGQFKNASNIFTAVHFDF